MLVAADDTAFAALVTGGPVGDLMVAADLESPETLTMLADLARGIRAMFEPAAWLIVERGMIVGLVSLVAPVVDRVAVIGYGVAPARRGAGLMRRAVGDLVALAAADGRLDALAAETAVANPASQRVLAANGFGRTGMRIDPDDGPMIGWRLDLPARP